MSKIAEVNTLIHSASFQMQAKMKLTNLLIVLYCSCCPEPYPDVTFYLHLRRIPGFYLFNIIIPTLVMSLLGILTFILPPEFGERITLVIESFLAMSLIVLMVMEKVPVNSDVTPLIIKMLLLSMIQIGLMLVANCIALNCWRDTELPQWVRVVFLHYMARMLFINTGNLPIKDDDQSDDEHTTDPEISKLKLAGTKPLCPPLLPLLEDMRDDNNINVNRVGKKFQKRPVDILNKLSEGFCMMTANELAEEHSEFESEFWAFTSQVFDRLFLLLFTVVFIFSSVYIFSEIPEHYTFSSIFEDS